MALESFGTVCELILFCTMYTARLNVKQNLWKVICYVN